MQLAQLTLGWSRAADGRFSVALGVPVDTKQGRQIIIPLHTFLLDQQEEASLRAALSGILIENHEVAGVEQWR